ncbi:MAG: M28 family peptidase [Candidatus Cloacimonetes bacterium]|nr:M28 family peptidase [Candidatus Cloacimonadota bacterium]
MSLTRCLLALVLASGLTAQAESFSRERSFSFLEQLCEIGPRYPGAPGHTAARDWLLATLAPLGDDVFLQNFSHPVRDDHPKRAEAGPTLNLSNIVCRFRPDVPRRILLTAHWESRPFCDQEKDPELAAQPLVGANDSASGVAILLELATLWSTTPPPIGVDIVLVDGEDWGEEGVLADYLLGSRHLARNLLVPAPFLAVNLDMLGDTDLDLQIERNSWQAAPDWVDLIWNTAADLGHDNIFQRRMGQAILDDHVPLIQAGIPAVNLIDFTYPAWHTTRDTPAQCSSESLGIIGDVLLETLRQLP